MATATTTVFIESAGTAMELAGVAVMLLGAAAATAWFVLALIRRGFTSGYRDYRVALGRAILLGLEFLVAGDIIRTVAVAPTIDDVLVLAIIVLIRTFLSLTLQVELEGRWPWQSGPRAAERR